MPSRTGWLTLAGKVEPYGAAEDPWTAFRSILAEHQTWVSDFIREHGIQTNEVQRCFVLLPVFLTLAEMLRKPLDLIELGTSAGLNLLWDRYRYRYAEGTWGPRNAELELAGSELSTVPADLLNATVVIKRRRGIDLDPVDISSEAGLRLLESFLLGDQPRVDRLRRAVEVARRDPPSSSGATMSTCCPSCYASVTERHLPWSSRPSRRSTCRTSVWQSCWKPSTGQATMDHLPGSLPPRRRSTDSDRVTTPSNSLAGA